MAVNLAAFAGVVCKWATSAFVIAAFRLAPTALVGQLFLAAAVGTATMGVGFYLLTRGPTPRVDPPQRGA